MSESPALGEESPLDTKFRTLTGWTVGRRSIRFNTKRNPMKRMRCLLPSLAASTIGLIQVTSDYDPIVSYHVTMDSEEDGADGLCSMTLMVDLSLADSCCLF